MSVQKKAKLFSLRCLLMDLIRITGALPGLVWLRPKIRYTAKQAKKRLRGGVLVIANHTSFIDPACMMYVLWYRRLYFVCHQAFVETKAGPFFRAAGCLIPINADNFSVGSFRSITESLRDGKAVTLFPEGHVNKGDEMLEFKSGMVAGRQQDSKRPAAAQILSLAYQFSIFLSRYSSFMASMGVRVSTEMASRALQTC